MTNVVKESNSNLYLLGKDNPQSSICRSSNLRYTNLGKGIKFESQKL